MKDYPPYVLVATGIGKSYRMPGQGMVRVLHQANIHVQSGEFVAVVGPSGSGKSTLLHILATLDQPDEGTVAYTVDNTTFLAGDLSVDATAHVRNATIGMVFQAHHLLPEFTVVENVMMPALIAGASHTEAYNRAVALVERVGMGHRKQHSPLELSGGEQQRTAIARALINRPRFLFADEPTGNLDKKNTEIVFDIFKELAEVYHQSLLIVTHDNEFAERTHRIIEMEDGRVIRM
jgi:lipoprotein-releasing system ATP-binding protein